MDVLADAFVYLVAAVIAVPLANRLGLGSVLGYLVAGIAIGPVLGFVGSESETIQGYAEFGVVMMLFLVGLELRPAMLWQMRANLLGLGGLQVVGSIALVGAAGMALGLDWQMAVAIGMIMCLSSTAIVLQTLSEKGWLKTPPGQASFSVLLAQDIAFIPILAALPFLALLPVAGGGEGAEAETLISGLPAWLQAGVIVLAVASIVIGGRFLVRPIFRYIASAGLREVFTAAALLLVIGIALLMDVVGLSPALGTFLAGVVLSDSEYRHELESDVEPFKGLLLGLFFISVGAGIDFGLLGDKPLEIGGLAVGIIAAKMLVLLILGFAFGHRGAALWLFAISIAQVGEFAFVLFAFAELNGVLGNELSKMLTLVVTLTMMMTPLMFIFYALVIEPRGKGQSPRAEDEIDETGTVVLAGVGRFGQIIARILVGSGYKVVVLDHDAEQVTRLARIGIKAFYGDASRPDLLYTAGIKDATVFVAALDSPEKNKEVIRHVAKTYPDVRIIARARDRHDYYILEESGAHVVIRELFEGAVETSREVLKELGVHPFQAEQQVRRFRRHDFQTIEDLREHWTEDGVTKNYLSAMRGRGEQLAEVLNSDIEHSHDSTAQGWTPPPKGDADA